jgi:hypothetical protein
MGASRTSFAKLQRDRAKKAKAAAKRERRLDKDGEPIESEGAEGLDGVEVVDDGEEISADQLLKMVEELHADFEAKRIDFETFEERKTELFARISVD